MAIFGIKTRFHFVFVCVFVCCPVCIKVIIITSAIAEILALREWLFTLLFLLYAFGPRYGRKLPPQLFKKLFDVIATKKTCHVMLTVLIKSESVPITSNYPSKTS